jgi:hypothetical protein
MQRIGCLPRDCRIVVKLKRLKDSKGSALTIRQRRGVLRSAARFEEPGVGDVFQKRFFPLVFQA